MNNDNATNFGTLTTTDQRGRVSKLSTSHAHKNLPGQRALDPFTTTPRADAKEVAALCPASIAFRRWMD